MQISFEYSAPGWKPRGAFYSYSTSSSSSYNFQYNQTTSGRPPPAWFYYHLNRLSLQANVLGEMLGLLKSAPRYMQINSIANAINKMLESYSKNLSAVSNFFNPSYNFNGNWPRNNYCCGAPHITIKC